VRTPGSEFVFLSTHLSVNKVSVGRLYVVVCSSRVLEPAAGAATVVSSQRVKKPFTVVSSGNKWE